MVVQLNSCVETMMHFFPELFNEKNNNIYLNQNTDTTTFDQFIASLLDKSTNFLKKKQSYWPKTYEQYCIS